MKILIIGGTSLIGWQLVNFCIANKMDAHFTYFTHKISSPLYSYLDITKKESTIKLIKRIEPDIVIHASAFTKVDECETNKDLANSINVTGLFNVLEGCKKTNSMIIFISTSFVFNGKKSLYDENDSTSPINYYGITKFRGEELVKNSTLPYLILRTDQPYFWKTEWQKTNSVIRVLETLRAKNTLREIKDWSNTPTYVPDFVNALFELINKKATGIFHVVGSEFINRYEWALQIADIFELDKTLITPINSSELKLSAKRNNVHLNNEKLYKATGIRMKGIHEGLIEMKKSMIHNS